MQCRHHFKYCLILSPKYLTTNLRSSTGKQAMQPIKESSKEASFPDSKRGKTEALALAESLSFSNSLTLKIKE